MVLRYLVVLDDWVRPIEILTPELFPRPNKKPNDAIYAVPWLR